MSQHFLDALGPLIPRIHSNAAGAVVPQPPPPQVTAVGERKQVVATCSPGKPATTLALLTRSGKHTGMAMSSRITRRITLNPMTTINFKRGCKLPRLLLSTLI